MDYDLGHHADGRDLADPEGSSWFHDADNADEMMLAHEDSVEAADFFALSMKNRISAVGYAMFPLADSGKEIASFQEIMHMAVTAAVVPLSIASLVCMIVAGFKKGGKRGIGIWAAIALIMMMVGAIGQGAVPPQYFGIVERFSVFAAVGFNAVLGISLFRKKEQTGSL